MQKIVRMPMAYIWCESLLTSDTAAGTAASNAKAAAAKICSFMLVESSSMDDLWAQQMVQLFECFDNFWDLFVLTQKIFFLAFLTMYYSYMKATMEWKPRVKRSVLSGPILSQTVASLALTLDAWLFWYRNCKLWHNILPCHFMQLYNLTGTRIDM